MQSAFRDREDPPTPARNGPVALVGSGEFLPVMEEVDRALLEGRPARVVFLPTAAAQEGPARIEYWVELGVQHYRRIGVEAEALLVLDRTDADRPDLAQRVEGAGLVYLSGGSPAYLIDTLRDTAVWSAILDAWYCGAALAGCSAGAIALSGFARQRRGSDASPHPGLGVVANVSAIPHFDRMMRFAPQIATQGARGLPAGVMLVGLDEDTAIVGGPLRWSVHGRRHAWVLGADTEPKPYAAGAVIDLDPRL